MKFFIKHIGWVLAAVILAGVTVTVGLFITQKRSGIEYLAPRYGPIIEAIYGLGKVKTDDIYEVKLGVASSVAKLYVREGDRVKRNDLLVSFENDLVFRAPFAGTVTLIAHHEAQNVFPQQTVLRVEDLSTKYIEVSLEQQGALRVRPGQPVRIVFESIRGEQLSGVVSAVFPRNDEFLAHIKVKLADNVLPGMTADVAIEVDRKESALLVPLSAVTDGQVRVLREGKRKTIKLKIGSIDGNWAEVVEGGLQQSDRILVKREKERGL
ncbi:MAG: efflux RND transporter periplasmic adaptor subunit [Gammaproteobacteria bacterium]|nr:efflux RND transporter periplasmic adaptor subunit [Gammaproteobacteria bacterium]